METDNGEHKSVWWGAWATAGFGFLILLAFVLTQTIVVIAYGFVKISSDRSIDPAEFAETLGGDGTLLLLALIGSSVVCVSLSWLFAWAKREQPVRDYLGLIPVSPTEVVRWAIVAALVAGLVDSVAFLLGRPVIPEFMTLAYASVASKPLLCIGVCLISPFFEEVVFRGFLFGGFQNSRLGSVGATIVTSLAWTSIHLQYGWYDLTVVFLGGLLLGYVRVKTGSILPTFAMHFMINLIATTETVVWHQVMGGS